ncbi:MAG: hypothetical protein M3345_00610, partial [Actinomycetota bacterium]|nr:hypothetical protein [Actinomycetota bacterium]
VVSPASVVAGGTTDLSVSLTVYKGDGNYDRVHEGPLVIPREYSFVFKVRNDGASRTTATLRYSVSPSHRDPGYKWWAIPAEMNGSIVFDDATRCDGRRCTLGIGPGQERWVVGVFMDGNAPGMTTVEGRVSSSVGDTDLTDNAVTVQRRVTCSITGTAGDDRLQGTSSTDSICGGAGADTLIGIGSGDRIFGGRGKDLMKGDRAPQTFIGGRGTDTVSYQNAEAMVYIFLREMVSNGWARDHLIKPEIVIGSRYADYMEGSARGERIDGWRGNDEIYGDSGRDSLVGGSGDDEFDTRDGVSESIRGGLGRDVAYSDAGDDRRSAAYSSYRTFPDRS